MKEEAIIKQAIDHVNSLYPFLLENKAIHYKYIHIIESCIEEFLIEKDIDFTDSKIRTIALSIFNSEDRVRYILGENSNIYDLSGNKIREIDGRIKYTARVKLQEINNEKEVKKINFKLKILSKKLEEIQQWKNDYIKLDRKIKERFNDINRIEERISEKRKSLNADIQRFKMDKNEFEQQKSSKNIKIGNYLKDYIIQKHLDSTSR